MKQGRSIAIIWQRAQLSQSSRYGQIFCWTSWLNWTGKLKIRQNRLCRFQNTGNQRKIKMDNKLNANNYEQGNGLGQLHPDKRNQRV